jgi:Tfp pilus assembly protein PilE
LVVVLIIGILASIAVPQYKLAVHKARIRSYLPTLRAIAEAEELHYLANNTYVGVERKEELDFSFPKECQPLPTNTNRLSCNNHVTLVTFGDPSGPYPGASIAVGMLYCYDGSQPCGDNQNIQFRKAFEHQYEGSAYAGKEGRWMCACRSGNDTFCQKLCLSIWQDLNPPRQ